MRSQYAALMDEIVKRWSASEACQLPLEGCSEAEIEEIKRRQGVERLPEMYVEFLRRIGKYSGNLGWHFGSEITYPDVLEFKEDTFDVLHKPDIYVFTHDPNGDCAIYFHVGDDDPVLYWISYDDSRPQSYDLITEDWGRLSTWLVNLVERVIEVHDLWKKRDHQQ
jgi:hypothetical protein